MRIALRCRPLPAAWIVVVIAASAFTAALPSPAQALSLREVARFRQPVHVTAPRGAANELYVVERAGRIKVVRNGRKLRRAFLDIRGLVDLDLPQNQFRDQGGLASLAFAPDYRRSGRFYVFYTHRNGTLHVDEFRRARGSRLRASRSSRRTLLEVPRGRKRTDLGGHVEFGPDGYLYVGIGFVRDPESSQDLGALTGKILRVDPGAAAPGSAYGIPADNPFVGRPGARPEIFAFGVRMPWRFSFDPAGGELIIADVGDVRFEEVDVLGAGGAGANLGWPFFEGRRRHEPGGPSGLTFPVLERRHSPTVCAIVGGYVIRKRGPSSLRGRYVYGDVCSGRVRSARLRTPRARGDRSENLTVAYLVSFGRDARGGLYAVSLLGSVYRVSG
jgi:glucose/arabinose dehydrogenase